MAKKQVILFALVNAKGNLVHSTYGGPYFIYGSEEEAKAIHHCLHPGDEFKRVEIRVID